MEPFNARWSSEKIAKAKNPRSLRAHGVAGACANVEDLPDPTIDAAHDEGAAAARGSFPEGVQHDVGCVPGEGDPASTTEAVEYQIEILSSAIESASLETAAFHKVEENDE